MSALQIHQQTASLTPNHQKAVLSQPPTCHRIPSLLGGTPTQKNSMPLVVQIHEEEADGRPVLS